MSMKLIGLARIGNEPELRYTSGSMAVLQLSLAYSYGKEKKTQWVSATLFGKRAESIVNFLSKGQLLYVEVTDVNIDTFKGKDGADRVSLKGIIQEVQFTGKTEQPNAAQTTMTPQPKEDRLPGLENIEDDSIPF
jgi:single-strand DNA-binding protein